MPHSGPFARGIHVTRAGGRSQRPSTPRRLLRGAARLLRAARRSCASSAEAPRVKDVVGSNYAHLSARARRATRVAVMCAIDNLNKGAAGGAVQWMNRLFGLPETAGLTAPAAGLDLKPMNAASPARRSACRERLPGARVRAVPARGRVRAEGVWLHQQPTAARVLDLYGGHAVAALGYGHPGWTAALARQAQTLRSRATRCRWRCASARRRAWSRFARCRFDQRLLRQQRRRGQRERAEAGAAHHRPRASRRHRGRLPRPHRRGRRPHLGRAPEVVRLSARALRRRASCRARDAAALAAHVTEHDRGRHRRAGAGRSPAPSISGAEFLAALRAALRRGRRAADLRRGAVRHGPHRRSPSRPTSTA